MSKIYFITGASSGFGQALAEAVLERGDSAIIAARKKADLSDLASRFPDTALAVDLDITKSDQRKAALAAGVQRFGHVDVLANCAGQGSLGAAEEFSSTQLRDHLEVNFFGVVELIRECLPSMRARKSGHLVTITSIGGLVNLAGFSIYGASKFGLEGFSEALHDEVKSLGIHVTLVEPGAFRTKFSGAANLRPATHLADYDPVLEPIRKMLYGNDGKQPGDPKKAALAIIAAVENKNPPLHLLLGADAFQMWEKKRTALEKDISDWRQIGSKTGFEGPAANS